MASFHDTDPNAPRIPEILEEASYLPRQARIILGSVSLELRQTANGVALGVQPLSPYTPALGFTILTEQPAGITSIFFGVYTDFEASMPEGVIPRPDSSEGRMMLALQGIDRVVKTLRYGNALHQAPEIGYGGPVGIEKFWFK